MKIGLITTHSAINYGALLQAYALQKYLQSEKNSCEIINYYPNDLAQIGRKTEYKMSSIKTFVYSLLLILNFKYRRSKSIKIKYFDNFIKNKLYLSGKIVNSLEQANMVAKNYDILVCGSDQIWNLNLFSSDIYFLNFKLPKETRKISYAPSIAEKLSANQMLKISKLVNSFDSISVRENQAAQELTKLLQKKVYHVLDPVFLLSKKQWETIAKPVDIKEPFILCYTIGASINFKQSVNILRRNQGLPLVYINLSPFDKFNSEYNLTNVSPEQFVWLFLNAKFIITSSFHGLAFSIIFNKQFFAYPSEDRNSRHLSLMKSFGLESRLLNEENLIEKCSENSSIDYDKINPKIEEFIKFSKSYLNSSLNND